jgi:AbrB family looped-hinge helix DNA binding protein
MLTAKVDPKGRVMIPQPVRKELGIEPGDTLVIEFDEQRKIAHCAKAENPFDVLAAYALWEFDAGRTCSLREFVAENNISLDDD